ncbi:MAG: helix-turn-helix domain-containing protein [Caulobacteraceae bacterium]
MVKPHEGAGPDPIDIQVGVTIRQLRKDRGISQSELGAALGITFQQVQKYERGVNRISASMLVRTAIILDVQPSALLPQTDAEPMSPGAQRAAFTHGAWEVAETYAGIKSPRQRRALLELVRAMGGREPVDEDETSGDAP